MSSLFNAGDKGNDQNVYKGQTDQDQYYAAKCHIFFNFEAVIYQFKNNPDQK